MNEPASDEQVRQRIGLLRTRIQQLAGPRSVELIAVTKGFGPRAVTAAAAAGCLHVGESYAQELRDKWLALGADAEQMTVHFIGQMQRNKVRIIAPLVHVWHSVDRPSLAAEIAARAPQAQVFVQVDATDELGKGGCRPAEVPALVARCTELGLAVRGLMAVGPTSADPVPTRVCFRMVRAMADDLGLADCSMGMSSDLDIAIEEGSTHVRIGSAIFGERPRPRR